MASRGEEIAAVRARRQKLFVGAGAGVLIAILGFQLPGLLSSGSGSSSDSSPLPARRAVPVAKPIPTAPKSAESSGISRLQARDIFVPQVRVSSGGASLGASGPELAKGPSVRAKDFVTKDPFVVQVTVPTAPAAVAATIVPATPSLSATPTDAETGSSYIVILGTVAGTSDVSRKAAARAIVAAKNAGLKDVTTNPAVPGTGRKPHYTIFTGPYPSAAMAHFELVRALRNGYPHAHTEQFAGSGKKGF